MGYYLKISGSFLCFVFYIDDVNIVFIWFELGFIKNFIGWVLKEI